MAELKLFIRNGVYFRRTPRKRPFLYDTCYKCEPLIIAIRISCRYLVKALEQDLKHICFYLASNIAASKHV